MQHQDADLAIYQHITQLATVCRQKLAKLAEPFRLTGSQLQMLISIQPDHPAPMKDLCTSLGCDPSYVTNTIERLVSLKLLQRHEAPEDRRIKMITLTPKGQQIRALVIADFPNQAPTAALDTHEKQQFLSLCEKMSEQTAKHN